MKVLIARLRAQSQIQRLWDGLYQTAPRSADNWVKFLHGNDANQSTMRPLIETITPKSIPSPTKR